MGYSARYHAASLAAVFLALAVGIVIGAGLGEDIVAGTSESLEESLQSDVEDARARSEELSVALERERDFGSEAYPALVGGTLAGERVALVGLGELSEETAGDVQGALGPADARVVEVAVVRLPPDLESVYDALGRRAGEGPADDPPRAEGLGRLLGRQLVEGGALLHDARQEIFTRYSGRPEEVEGVVLAREAPAVEDTREAELQQRFETGLMEGLARSRARVVAVERTGTDPSSIELFDSHGLSTVDDVDLVAGKVAAVLALRGAEGNFGIKDTADQLLPDLLATPSRGRQRGEAGAGSARRGEPK